MEQQKNQVGKIMINNIEDLILPLLLPVINLVNEMSLLNRCDMFDVCTYLLSALREARQVNL